MQLGKFRTKNTKRQKTQLPFLKSQEQKKMGIWEQKRDCTCPLHPTPPKWWANHLSDPFSQATGYTPTLTPYKGQGCPPTLGEQAKKLVTFFYFLLQLVQESK